MHFYFTSLLGWLVPFSIHELVLYCWCIFCISTTKWWYCVSLALLCYICVSCFSLCCSSLPVPVCICMCCHLVAYLLMLQYVPYCSQSIGWLSDPFYLTRCCVPFQMTPLCSNVMMRIKVHFRLIVNVATVCVYAVCYSTWRLGYCLSIDWLKCPR